MHFLKGQNSHCCCGEFQHRLFQVEYAIEAVKLGSTAVGIQTSHGVVLASEKRLTSSLLEPSSVEKIMEIDSHVGAAVSGLIGDARTLIDHARVEAQNHRFTFDEVRILFVCTSVYIKLLTHCFYLVNLCRSIDTIRL